MPTLTVIVGESGSGKSTKATQMLKEAQDNGRKMVRVSRDGLRRMLYGEDSDWKVRLRRDNESFTQQLERSAAYDALEAGYDVLVDDINLSEKTQDRWKKAILARGYGFETYRMDTDIDTCIRRDSDRKGKECIGRPVIENQFLKSGRAPIENRPTVIVDVDGTLADSDGIRSPYDESKVIWDRDYPVVTKWVQELYTEYQVIIVSGRHASCGEHTTLWLSAHGIPYHRIYMRDSGDNRPDTVVKREILEGILKYIPKEQIKFVLDDRPKVIREWKSQGLTVYPVRGQVEEF